VRKLHTYRLDAFSSGDAGPIARVEEGRLRRHRTWPVGKPLGLGVIGFDPGSWPQVEVVTSHAGAGPRLVDALVAAGIDGLVVATTGNGSLHQALEPALRRAATAGVAVLRCTRCASGVLVGSGVAAEGAGGALPAAATLSPWQARVELLLSLLAGGQAQPPFADTVPGAASR